MKMVMTDGDIITSYRQAKDPAAQIKVLADLNCCRAGEMREYLIMLGCDVPPAKVASSKLGAAKAPIVEMRAMELYNEGYNDLSIAETLGVPTYRVAQFRKRMNLKANVSKRKPLGKNGNPKTAPEQRDVEKESAQGYADAHDGVVCEPINPAVLRMDRGKQPFIADNSVPMTLGALTNILQTVSNAFENVQVECCTEGSIVRVGVVVEYVADDKPACVKVQLFGK